MCTHVVYDWCFDISLKTHYLSSFCMAFKMAAFKTVLNTWDQVYDE